MSRKQREASEEEVKGDRRANERQCEKKRGDYG